MVTDSPEEGAQGRAQDVLDLQEEAVQGGYKWDGKG